MSPPRAAARGQLVVPAARGSPLENPNFGLKNRMILKTNSRGLLLLDGLLDTELLEVSISGFSLHGFISKANPGSRGLSDPILPLSKAPTSRAAAGPVASSF